MSAADAPATHRDRQRLVLRLAELGIPTTDTDRQRHVCAVWTKGRARKRSELTQRDARSLYARLQTMTADELAAVEAMPVPHTSPAAEEATAALAAAAQDGIELDARTAACLASWDDAADAEGTGPLSDVPHEEEPAPELPAGVITCGGEPSAADVAAVAAFAAELAERGPAPDREELAAAAPGRELRVAGWVGIPGRFVPLPGEPAATVEEPGPADTGDALRPGPRDGDDRATVADHGPAVPAPVAVEPVPEDVEAAALAAVERFRARQAAGIIPEPPNPAARPPRAVVPYGAPGRYCLARCYCGGCPQYAEQKAEAERLYAIEVRRATADPDDMPRRRR
jgi:hypothetical protein